MLLLGATSGNVMQFDGIELFPHCLTQPMTAPQ